MSPPVLHEDPAIAGTYLALPSIPCGLNQLCLPADLRVIDLFERPILERLIIVHFLQRWKRQLYNQEMMDRFLVFSIARHNCLDYFPQALHSARVHLFFVINKCDMAGSLLRMVAMRMAFARIAHSANSFADFGHNANLFAGNAYSACVFADIAHSADHRTALCAI